MTFFRTILSFFLLVSALASMADNPVMVTGAITNQNTNCFVQDLPFINVAGGYPADIHVNFNSNSTRGRFIFSLPKGKTAFINIVAQGNCTSPAKVVCKLKVTVVDDTHAVITQIGGVDPGSPVLGSYSGDPDNNTNTAVILLTNNIK